MLFANVFVFFIPNSRQLNFKVDFLREWSGFALRQLKWQELLTQMLIKYLSDTNYSIDDLILATPIELRAINLLHIYYITKSTEMSSTFVAKSGRRIQQADDSCLF